MSLPVVEERIDSLEAVLGRFLINTDLFLKRLERDIRENNRQLGALAKKM